VRDYRKAPRVHSGGFGDVVGDFMDFPRGPFPHFDIPFDSDLPEGVTVFNRDGSQNIEATKKLQALVEQEFKKTMDVELE